MVTRERVWPPLCKKSLGGGLNCRLEPIMPYALKDCNVFMRLQGFNILTHLWLHLAGSPPCIVSGFWGQHS